MTRRARARVRWVELDHQLAKRLGLGPREQLSLALDATTQAAAAIRSGQTQCPSCGRWNYHLAGCARRDGGGHG